MFAGIIMTVSLSETRATSTGSLGPEGWQWRMLCQRPVVRCGRSVGGWRSVWWSWCAGREVMRCRGMMRSRRMMRSWRMMVRASVTCRIWRDGVCVSTWRTVTSVMEVVVRRQAVVRWRGAVTRSDTP